MLGGVCWLKPLTWRYSCGSPCQRSFVYQCGAPHGWPARMQDPASKMRRNALLKQCLALFTIFFEENHDSKLRATLLVTLPETALLVT